MQPRMGYSATHGSVTGAVFGHGRAGDRRRRCRNRSDAGRRRHSRVPPRHRRWLLSGPPHAHPRPDATTAQRVRAGRSWDRGPSPGRPCGSDAATPQRHQTGAGHDDGQQASRERKYGQRRSRSITLAAGAAAVERAAFGPSRFDGRRRPGAVELVNEVFPRPDRGHGRLRPCLHVPGPSVKDATASRRPGHLSVIPGVSDPPIRFSRLVCIL